jgi:long-chain acyl-CoA synthetase
MAQLASPKRITATSIAGAFEQTAERFAERPALKGDGGLGAVYTYVQMAERVRKLAAGLNRAMPEAQLEIGLLSENRPEWPISYLAVLRAGKIVVPIDANLKADEIGKIIRHAGLSLVLCSGRFEGLLTGLPGSLKYFSFEADSPRSWQPLFEGDEEVSSAGKMETAVLIFTSGTTGAPKAVELTHKNLLSNVEGAAAALQLDENDTFISVLPLHHTFEATCGFLMPMMTGGCIVFARSFKSREIFEDIGLNKCTVMCGVPLLYEKAYQTINRQLQQAPAVQKALFRTLYTISGAGWRLKRKWGRSLFGSLRARAGLSSVRMFVSGGAALPPKIAEFFNLVGFDFLQGYGLTETSPVLSVNRPHDIQFGSVGPPLPNVQIRIDSMDRQGVGEIVVRGDNVSPGYRDNPEKTAELIRDGWLYTGDLGRFKKGHLWITGRAKNIIVTAAGKNIYPEELEERLIESRYVLEALVFGRAKSGKQGEEVRALIVPDIEQFKAEFGVDPGAPDMDRVRDVIKGVIDDVNSHVADFKRLSGFDIRLEELEKSSAKKIKRFIYK